MCIICQIFFWWAVFFFDWPKIWQICCQICQQRYRVTLRKICYNKKQRNILQHVVSGMIHLYCIVHDTSESEKQTFICTVKGCTVKGLICELDVAQLIRFGTNPFGFKSSTWCSARIFRDLTALFFYDSKQRSIWLTPRLVIEYIFIINLFRDIILIPFTINLIKQS
jgi:hypothetical protein